MSTPTNIGRYQIAGEIGRGAMGIVYKATDPNIGRTVALKTMRVDVHGADEEEILQRFKHEAKLAGVMSHANIVTVHDAGEDAGVFFMAMEFLEGVTLHSVLKEKRVLPLQRVIEIARDVGAGLDFAHVHGVIHRDVKPANIMCTRNGGVKIMDFGIAKSGAGMTSAGQVLGTPTYMSPEQVRGKVLDGRSDLFSFGVILYEMVTGEKPFSGQNVTTIIYKIMNEAPIAPRDLDASVDSGVSAVIIKALAKNPNERYQTAAELVRELENCKAAGSETESTKMIAAVGASGTHAAASEPMPAIITSYEALSAKEDTHSIRSEPQTTTKMPGSIGGPGVNSSPMQSAAEADALLQSIQTVVVGQRANSPSNAVTRTGTKIPSKKMGLVAAAVLLIAVVVVGWQLRPSRGPQPQASSAQVPAATNNPAEQPMASETSPATSKPSPAKAAVSPSAKSKNAPMAAAKTARVVIKSTPAGAAIVLDKKETGKVTPVQLKVEAGKHEIRLRKEFYRDASASPTLKEGETYNYAPVLEPQKSGGGNPFHALKGMFGGQKIPEGKGLVQIKTKPPGAQIIYQGSSVGQTTPLKLPLDPGTYRVSIKLTGYRTQQKDFTVVKGKTLEVNVDLQPK